MALMAHSPVIEKDDSAGRSCDFSRIRSMDDHDSLFQLDGEEDIFGSPSEDASGLDVSQQDREAHKFEISSPSPEDDQQHQDGDTTMPETEVLELTGSAAIAMKPQTFLSSDQKEYLAHLLMRTQKRKFVAPFLSSGNTESNNGSQASNTLDLSAMLTKLLEDQYDSAESFRDDVKNIIQRCATEGTSDDSANNHGKQLLDHVDKYLEKLPKPKSAEGEVDRLTAGKKRKAENGTKKEVAAKRAKLAGPTMAQQKEMAYARKQVIAYRDGKQSNEHKTCQNLVIKAILRSESKDEKNNIKIMAKNCRAESTFPLQLRSGQEGKGDGDGDEIENETNDEDSQASPRADLNNDPVGVDTRSPRDGGDSDDEEHLVTSQQISDDTNDSETQSSRKPRMAIKTCSYKQHLSELSTDLPTQEQIAKLDYTATTGPNFLGRTAATERGWNFGQYFNKTNGYTSPDVLLPAADSRNVKHCSHERLADMTQGELIYMIGNHQIWKDLVADEFLSYSKDTLFLVVHALRRYHEKQGDVTIQFLDRRQATDKNGRPAKFYGALDLYTTFKVPQWSGWGNANNIKLHPRKFTQEYLTHGPVLTRDTIFRQARIEDLIRDGLFDIFPEFATPEDEKRAGLYTLQVVYRKIGYPPAKRDSDGEKTKQTGSKSSDSHTPALQHDAQTMSAETSSSQSSEVNHTLDFVRRHSPIYSYDNCLSKAPMTIELLNAVRKVTLNFITVPEGSERSDFEPPLHAFISFLTFEKRQTKDPVFMEFIQKHYKAHDVKDLYTDPEGRPLPGMTVVADNLPGYMQYLDLIRDCIDLFALTPLPPNEIETKHVFDRLWDFSYEYAAYDDLQHREHKKSEKYEPAVHGLLRRAESKRRAKKRQSLTGSRASDEASETLVTPPNSQLEATEQESDARQSSVEDEGVVVAKSGLLRGITEE